MFLVSWSLRGGTTKQLVPCQAERVEAGMDCIIVSRLFQGCFKLFQVVSASPGLSKNSPPPPLFEEKRGVTTPAGFN